MIAIMVTDFEDTNNVCVFSKTLTIEDVEKRLIKVKKTYTDVFYVKDEELQFYLYSPCWIEKKKQKILKKN